MDKKGTNLLGMGEARDNKSEEKENKKHRTKQRKGEQL